MLIKDLIWKLQEIRLDHEKVRYFKGKDMLGEADIYIDVFGEVPGTETTLLIPGEYRYQGASREIKIEVSSDGVMNILSAFSDSYPREET